MWQHRRLHRLPHHKPLQLQGCPGQSWSVSHCGSEAGLRVSRCPVLTYFLLRHAPAPRQSGTDAYLTQSDTAASSGVRLHPARPAGQQHRVCLVRDGPSSRGTADSSQAAVDGALVRCVTAISWICIGLNSSATHDFDLDLHCFAARPCLHLCGEVGRGFPSGLCGSAMGLHLWSRAPGLRRSRFITRHCIYSLQLKCRHMSEIGEG
jgi:hypothetical protein